MQIPDPRLACPVACRTPPGSVNADTYDYASPCPGRCRRFWNVSGIAQCIPFSISLCFSRLPRLSFPFPSTPLSFSSLVRTASLPRAARTCAVNTGPRLRRVPHFISSFGVADLKFSIFEQRLPCSRFALGPQSTRSVPRVTKALLSVGLSLRFRLLARDGLFRRTGQMQ